MLSPDAKRQMKYTYPVSGEAVCTYTVPAKTRWSGHLCLCTYAPVASDEHAFDHPERSTLYWLDGATGVMKEYPSNLAHCAVAILGHSAVHAGTTNVDGSLYGAGDELAERVRLEQCSRVAAIGGLMASRRMHHRDAPPDTYIGLDKETRMFPYHANFSWGAGHFAAHLDRGIAITERHVTDAVRSVSTSHADWALLFHADATDLVRQAVLLAAALSQPSRTMPYVNDTCTDTYYVGAPDGGDCEDVVVVVAAMATSLLAANIVPKYRENHDVYCVNVSVSMPSGDGPQMHSTVAVVPRRHGMVGCVAEGTSDIQGSPGTPGFDRYGTVVHAWDVHERVSYLVTPPDSADEWGVSMEAFLRRACSLVPIHDTGYDATARLVEGAQPLSLHSLTGGQLASCAAMSAIQHKQMHRVHRHPARPTDSILTTVAAGRRGTGGVGFPVLVTHHDTATATNPVHGGAVERDIARGESAVSRWTRAGERKAKELENYAATDVRKGERVAKRWTRAGEREAKVVEKDVAADARVAERWARAGERKAKVVEKDAAAEIKKGMHAARRATDRAERDLAELAEHAAKHLERDALVADEYEQSQK